MFTVLAVLGMAGFAAALSVGNRLNELLRLFTAGGAGR
jgi:hypothetical protein